MIEVMGLAQLGHAFERVAIRSEPIEGFHFGINSLVRNAQFALYRDFQDRSVNAVKKDFDLRFVRSPES